MSMACKRRVYTKVVAVKGIYQLWLNVQHNLASLILHDSAVTRTALRSDKLRSHLRHVFAVR